jgi:hypothetical protein
MTGGKLGVTLMYVSREAVWAIMSYTHKSGYIRRVMWETYCVALGTLLLMSANIII